MLISSIVVSSAVAIIITNSTAASKVEQGQMAYEAAESGLEEAIIQLLRNPDFSGTVSHVSTGLSEFSYTIGPIYPKTIDSYGSYHQFTRHLNTTATYNLQGSLIIGRWQEIY